MSSLDKMINSSQKRMSPNALVSSSKIKRMDDDAMMLFTAFDTVVSSRDMNSDGIHGISQIAVHDFAGVKDVRFFKTTQSFGMTLGSKKYDAPRTLVLLNKPSAHDVTESRLKDFVYKDSLVLRKYIKGDFMCGDFAGRLHNKAEAQGIRCGFVTVKFPNMAVHAFNVFCAIDEEDKSNRHICFVDMSDKYTPVLLYNSSFKRLKAPHYLSMNVYV